MGGSIIHERKPAKWLTFILAFTLIQAAIENGLDPYRYLTWLLRTAKDANLTDTQTVQNLLPWNIPAEYRVK